ncbi:MAG: hypothetical protein ACFFAS_09930 [Promethearchaeota archaeon]
MACNCFKEGKTKSCPFPQHVLLNEEGSWTLDLPWEEHESEYEEFREWIKDACLHERMEIVKERVSNWSGVRLFQEAMRENGSEHFPVLLSEIPDVNGGHTSADLAAKMQSELEFFKNLPSLGKSIWLIDTETGGLLHEHVKSHDGIFMLGGGNTIQFGLDPAGFFVFDKQSNKVVFRSSKFEQKIFNQEMEKEKKGSRKGVRFVDMPSGRTWEGNAFIPGEQIPWPDGKLRNDKGQFRSRFPLKLHIEERDRIPSDFEYIIEPLLRLCTAACETRNPICWF